MATQLEFVHVVPFDDGRAAGRALGREALASQTATMLGHPFVRDTLGAMSRANLAACVAARLHTAPDYSRFPELEDIYPERLEYLRGFAAGAGCTLDDAAVHGYLAWRAEIDAWYHSLQDLETPPPADTHCSGVLLVGPDGALGGHSAESLPPAAPKSYRFRRPAAAHKWRARKPVVPDRLVLRVPRTGYIEGWGVGNEKGVACCAGTSCSTLLDDPIEDTWPIGPVPLLRFARDADHLAELYRRYTLHNWGRASMVWADAGGNALIVEKSFRRIGIRMLEGFALWCTEGYWESPEMAAFQRAKRREYLRRAGKHLGAGDMQYATDCAVRFTRIGELCHEPLGRGYDHINRILTDHAPFPRAVCRHGGPDTAPYDPTVTMASSFKDVTHNRRFEREWVPWKKFPCELPWTVTQFPPRS